MRQQTTIDDRGQSGINRVVLLVVTLAVLGIVASVLAPVALDELTGDNDVAFTDVSASDTEEVIDGSLNVTLDTINDTANTNQDINVTLTDVDSGNTLVLTNINEGASDSGTLEGETLTVTNDDVPAAETTADFTVSHPPDYAWSDGAKSLWGIIDLAIVLVIFLFAIGLAMAGRRIGG